MQTQVPTTEPPRVATTAIVLGSPPVPIHAIGERMRERRLQLRLTQDEVATDIGRSKSYVSQLENGNVAGPLTAEQLASVERALQLAPGELSATSDAAPLASYGSLPTTVTASVDRFRSYGFGADSARHLAAFGALVLALDTARACGGPTEDIERAVAQAHGRVQSALGRDGTPVEPVLPTVSPPAVSAAATVAQPAATDLALSLDYNGQPIRMVGTPDRPEWVAADVGRALTLGNIRSSLAALDVDEKGVQPLDTPGGRQQLVTVTEAGLYRLIFRSDKPEARVFQRWVMHDVLPSIRRHGCYPPPGGPADQPRVAHRVAKLPAVVPAVQLQPAPLQPSPTRAYADLTREKLVRLLRRHYERADAFCKAAGI